MFCQVWINEHLSLDKGKSVRKKKKKTIPFPSKSKWTWGRVVRSDFTNPNKKGYINSCICCPSRLVKIHKGPILREAQTGSPASIPIDARTRKIEIYSLEGLKQQGPRSISKKGPNSLVQDSCFRKFRTGVAEPNKHVRTSRRG